MGRGHVTGVLAVYAEGFREDLHRRGYTVQSAARLVQLTAHLSRWMDGVGLTVDKLTAEVIERFTETRRSEGYAGWRTARALIPVLDYLRGLGVLAVEEEPAEPSELEELLARYDHYLVAKRNLAQASRRSYLGVARGFLGWVQRAGHDVASLDAEAVVTYVRHECLRRAAGSASATTTGMRSLLRFLYLDDLAPALLSGAVPSPAAWSLAGLPRYLSPGEVAALLESCDTSSAAGRRDFAILIALVRLGLRAGELARLELGDIDWHHGELAVRLKGGRTERLPLPLDVGEAMVAWVTGGRPRGASAVFCRLRAPHGALSSGGISAVVRHASRRAGLAPMGAHRLRHTAATTMLARGASLLEVGRVLGHRLPHTTAIYAKVDLDGLAELVRPWPEARP
jgi:site-specific recombinase XerD